MSKTAKLIAFWLLFGGSLAGVVLGIVALCVCSIEMMPFVGISTLCVALVTQQTWDHRPFGVD